MKKALAAKSPVIKVLGITVLVAVFGFIFTACGGKDIAAEEEMSLEKIRLSNLEVDFSSQGNFVYTWNLDGVSPTKFIRLSNYLTKTPKIEIIDGKLTLELDAPKTEVMESFEYFFANGEGAVTPDDAKFFWLRTIFDNSRTYALEGTTHFIYVDKDVTIDGYDENSNYKNLTLKMGWNYLLYEDASEYGATYTKAVRICPEDVKWFVWKIPTY